jgi:hypothetical protein
VGFHPQGGKEPGGPDQAVDVEAERDPHPHAAVAEERDENTVDHGAFEHDQA